MSKQLFEVELPDGTIVEGPTKEAALIYARKRLGVVSNNEELPIPKAGAPLPIPKELQKGNQLQQDIDRLEIEREQADEKAKPFIAGGIGAATGLMTAASGVGAPASGLVGSVTAAAVDRYLRNLGQKTESPIQEATATGLDAVLNELFGLGLIKGASGIKGVIKEIGKKGSVAGKIAELNPTYSEYPEAIRGSSIVEDIFATSSKRKANEASAKLIEDKATQTVRTITGQPYKVTDLYESSYGNVEALTGAWDQMQGHARLRANNVKNIALANQLKGSGLVAPVTLIDELYKLKSEIKTPLGSRTAAETELLRDINTTIKQLNVQKDAAGNITGFTPLDFDTAWVSKMNFGDKGFSNPKVNQGIVDVRYKRLFHAIDQDVEKSIPNWQENPQQALQNFIEAKEITNFKYNQFMPEGSGEELTSLVLKKQGTKLPSTPVNKLSRAIKDPDQVQRMLNAGEYDLGGVKITNTNMRKELAGYSFMDAYKGAQFIPDSKNPGYVSLDPNKLQANMVEALNGKVGEKLFNRQSARDIQELVTDFARVDQALNTNPSRYVAFKLGGYGANIGASILAHQLGPSTMAGAGLIGAAISLNAVGRMMTNPTLARLLIAMQKGAPLGMSSQAASRLIASGLRGQTVNLQYEDGRQVRGTFNANDQFVPDSN